MPAGGTECPRARPRLDDSLQPGVMLSRHRRCLSRWHRCHNWALDECAILGKVTVSQGSTSHTVDRRRTSGPSATPIATLIASALLALLTSCGGSTTATATSESGSAPTGWKTFTYGKITISVPKSWSVFHNAVCSNVTAVNELYLGAPNGGCPYESGQITPTNSVTVTLTHGPVRYTTGEGCPPPGTVIGLVVDDARPCTSSNAVGTVIWWVPSAGVLIEAQGPATDRVLHTLHRA